jgi:protein dithiol oxidoreductase (disulfide-forming)
MLRRCLASLFMLICATVTVQATEFTKGDYYIEIDAAATKERQVTEYFSFFCPHCFKQEPLMQELVTSLPPGTKFIKHHVDGMPRQKPEIEHALSKALASAESLKVEDKMVAAIFEYIHVKRQTFDSIADIRALFLANGVGADDFDKVFASFTVNTRFAQMQANTAALRRQGINGVPTLIINGRYKPVLDKINSNDEYKALIAFLLGKTA